MREIVYSTLERRCKIMEKFLKWLKEYWFLVTCFAVVIMQLQSIKDDITTIKSDFEEKNSNVNKQFETIENELSTWEGRFEKIQNQVYVLGGADPKLIGLDISEGYKQSVIRCCGIIDSFVVSNAAIQATSVVAYNSKGDEYTVKDVAQKKLLLPYVDKENECIFYGQLDQYGNWDGECIVNVYQNNCLKLITEAVYDSGDLLTFKQAFPDAKKSDIWYFSKRTMRDGFSSGETWSFHKTGIYTQNFLYAEATAEDVLTLDSFFVNFLKTDSILDGYYNGNTSGGKFNDDSGKAYMVKYFNDGTVRTLYTGAFKNGTFEDRTGNAWMIGRLDIDEAYSYYKGPFSGGRALKAPEKNSNYWELDISEDRIQELIDGMTFSCQLNWSILKA